MSDELARVRDKRNTYHGVYAARVLRRRAQPLHVVRALRFTDHGLRQVYFDRQALCGVVAAGHIESGDPGKPGNATCDTCRREYAKTRKDPR